MHLRVWWDELGEPKRFWQGGKPTGKKATGIVIGEQDFCFTVRMDNGKFEYVQDDDITKSEWVREP
jgi:hypothetical protein